jgi:hypothetical protein
MYLNIDTTYAKLVHNRDSILKCNTTAVRVYDNMHVLIICSIEQVSLRFVCYGDLKLNWWCKNMLLTDISDKIVFIYVNINANTALIGHIHWT